MIISSFFHVSLTRDTNALQASIEEVVNVLADCFEEGKGYSTMNTYRLALSATLFPSTSAAVGSHPLICRFFKGVFRL